MNQNRHPRPSVISARKPGLIERASSRAIRSPLQRQQSVVNAATATEKIQSAGKAALQASAKLTKTGIKSSLRFMQFLRAYTRAIAAGFASFLLLTELANGHFNIFAILGSHLVAIIAAPFYALILSPTIFGLYRGLAQTGLEHAQRTYALGAGLGVLMLVQRIASGRFMLAGDDQADLFALATIASGLIAARTFNRAVDRMAVAEPADPHAA